MKIKIMLSLILSSLFCSLLQANTIYIENYSLKIRIQKPIKNQIINIDEVIDGKKVKIEVKIIVEDQEYTVRQLPEDLRNLL